MKITSQIDPRAGDHQRQGAPRVRWYFRDPGQRSRTVALVAGEVGADDVASVACDPMLPSLFLESSAARRVTQGGFSRVPDQKRRRKWGGWILFAFRLCELTEEVDSGRGGERIGTGARDGLGPRPCPADGRRCPGGGASWFGKIAGIRAAACGWIKGPVGGRRSGNRCECRGRAQKGPGRR